jgi:hypothetical protein
MPTHGQRAEKLRLSHPPRSASLWSSKAAWSRALDLLALLLLLDVRLAATCTCLFLSVPVDGVQTSRYLSAYACRRTCSCTASRRSGWGCHQSVPPRTQRCLRVRPPGPRRIWVRCHLSSQHRCRHVPAPAEHSMLQGCAAPAERSTLQGCAAVRTLRHRRSIRRSRCAAASATGHRHCCGDPSRVIARDTAARGASLRRASRPVFGCGSRRVSAPSFSPSLRCVSSRAAHRGPSRVVARDAAELVVASRTTIQPSLGPRRVQARRRQHQLRPATDAATCPSRLLRALRQPSFSSSEAALSRPLQVVAARAV